MRIFKGVFNDPRGQRLVSILAPGFSSTIKSRQRYVPICRCDFFYKIRLFFNRIGNHETIPLAFALGGRRMQTFSFYRLLLTQPIMYQDRGNDCGQSGFPAITSPNGLRRASWHLFKTEILFRNITASYRTGLVLIEHWATHHWPGFIVIIISRSYHT